MKKEPLVILTGPTAVGKSHLSIQLAKRINGEIISADSMQVYRHMDIGTAKIPPEEMEGVKHFLIDEYEPWDEFNVVRFQERAYEYIRQIRSRGHIPILVGGTGFYIQSVLYGIDFTENEDNGAVRSRLEEESRADGGAALYERLCAIDPESAKSIHPNNIKRVIRAVEFYELTGKRISEHNLEQKANEPAFWAAYFVLTRNREQLYQSIDLRIDQMLQQGLVEEVKNLQRLGCHKDMVSMQGLGYKEILAYLSGACTLEEAVYVLKRDTRHFAKRQLTWFRRERGVIWLDKDNYAADGQPETAEERILTDMLQILQEKGIQNEPKSN